MRTAVHRQRCAGAERAGSRVDTHALRARHARCAALGDQRLHLAVVGPGVSGRHAEIGERRGLRTAGECRIGIEHALHTRALVRAHGLLADALQAFVQATNQGRRVRRAGIDQVLRSREDAALAHAAIYLSGRRGLIARRPLFKSGSGVRRRRGGGDGLVHLSHVVAQPGVFDFATDLLHLVRAGVRRLTADARLQIAKRIGHLAAVGVVEGADLGRRERAGGALGPRCSSASPCASRVRPGLGRVGGRPRRFLISDRRRVAGLLPPDRTRRTAQCPTQATQRRAVDVVAHGITVAQALLRAPSLDPGLRGLGTCLARQRAGNCSYGAPGQGGCRGCAPHDAMQHLGVHEGIQAGSRNRGATNPGQIATGKRAPVLFGLLDRIGVDAPGLLHQVAAALGGCGAGDRAALDGLLCSRLAGFTREVLLRARGGRALDTLLRDLATYEAADPARGQGAERLAAHVARAVLHELAEIALPLQHIGKRVGRPGQLLDLVVLALVDAHAGVAHRVRADGVADQAERAACRLGDLSRRSLEAARKGALLAVQSAREGSQRWRLRLLAVRCIEIAGERLELRICHPCRMASCRGKVEP
ncbi:hypothetical protein ABIC63_000491 [Pseudacidovorax sp. 1753]|uniref:hypothetical protein n=1 Tax=Pseudacidovorax sp. 1753 TaxID=3156419 RepID=UPI0033981205